MKVLTRRRPSESRTWDKLRQRKWRKALAELVKVAQVEERNYAIWNVIGDAHFRCGSPRDAVVAWRRAADGYKNESLYENALALTKKILRMVPEETDLYLPLAELHLALGYGADSLATLRTYLRQCPRHSETELRAYFRKVIESNLQHLHLLEEITPLYREAGIQDPQLAMDLEKFVGSRRSVAVETAPMEEMAVEEAVSVEETKSHKEAADGLFSLDSTGEGISVEDEAAFAFSPETPPSPSERKSSVRSVSETQPGEALPVGEGRDHYDLGMVYFEMKLWDAAMDEFERARRDESLHFRAGLALAECLLAKGDPRRALELLEKFEKDETQSDEQKLQFELIQGEVHEALGNLTQALQHFETIYENQQTFGNVGESIQHLKERMTT
jgi:tetratricopeptide (TPR) repeat protein